MGQAYQRVTHHRGPCLLPLLMTLSKSKSVSPGIIGEHNKPTETPEPFKIPITSIRLRGAAALGSRLPAICLSKVAADINMHEIIRSHLLQDIEVTENRCRLGGNGHRMLALQQHSRYHGLFLAGARSAGKGLCLPQARWYPAGSPAYPVHHSTRARRCASHRSSSQSRVPANAPNKHETDEQKTVKHSHAHSPGRDSRTGRRVDRANRCVK